MESRHNKALKSIMWDYDITVKEMKMLIDGKTLKAGHYTYETLFIKMVSGLPWFSIVAIFGPEKIKELLTDDVIRKIWPKSVQEKYTYVRKRLQEALPDTK